MSDEVAAARRETLSLWQALLTAIAAAAGQRQERMAARGAAVLTVGVPPSLGEVARLVEDESEVAGLQWLSVAHVMATVSLLEAMQIIDSPSVTVTTFGPEPGMSAEHFFDAGGVELLARRAELLGRIEDQLDSALDDSARPPSGLIWTEQLDRALDLISSGRHDSALGHLVIALTLLVQWAVPETAPVASLPDLLAACPSLRELSILFARAQHITRLTADGRPAPLGETVALAEVMARAIGSLTASFPRSEVLAALEANSGR